ncbi:MAG: LysM peptidoglycan-binding domain-containing protein [Lachnospiraceae bacterium]|nr:LysM peptidoglycan-binding domain-containing protein [Lachnospiraceae bacterium]
MRGLRTGRIITSSAIIGYGNDPQNVYNKISVMTNSKGELYAYTPETSSTYTVVKGDTLYSLAKRFKVALADLVSWNGIGNPNLIYPGQVLKYSIVTE